MINEKELKEAVEYFKKDYRHFDNEEYPKHTKVVLALAEQVLNVKGFPKKRENKHINCYNLDEEYCIKCGENVEINPFYDRGFNRAIDLCELAAAKDYIHKGEK